MPIIIACANQKGGVAKTTTVITIGHGLAIRGMKTLLVDTDPQGHVARSLGLDKTPGLYRMIVDEEPINQVVVHARPNLDIIPSDKRTEKAKRYVVSMNYREHVLDSILGRADYDVILIDLAPSLDVLHVAALVTSDWLIIPTRLDDLAVDGVNEILRSYAEIANQGGKLQGFNVLPTFFDRTTNETRQQLTDLVNIFKESVWPPIPQDVKAREAPAYGQTLWEYAPNSTAIAGYQINGKRSGGYGQALERLVEMLYARR